jgi:integrase
MGSIKQKVVTKAVPPTAELTSKKGKRVARWRNAKGEWQTAEVFTNQSGQLRMRVQSSKYVAKYRDASGEIREVSTGCRSKAAALRKLAELERHEELIRSGVLTSAEGRVGQYQKIPLHKHFEAYLEYLRARQASPVRVANMTQQFQRVCRDCGFTSLADLSDEQLIRWLNQQTDAGMSAATANGYRETFVMFCNWCSRGSQPRLLSNPFEHVPRANVQVDPRRKRRSLTEEELVRLLRVARLRPIAECGRATTRKPARDVKRKRDTWHSKSLCPDSFDEAEARGRAKLQKKPQRLSQLERSGQERALIYKTLFLTGLRKGELASLTLGQVMLDVEHPHMILKAADEKNRQGSVIPLRGDLADDLRRWIEVILAGCGSGESDSQGNRPKGWATIPLFTVPAGLVRILDRDLVAAGIPKRDERGQTIDVHAMRHSFGTLLSKGGVPPRTAQAALRHSSIDLTMNLYTDPRLLEVETALDSLPALSLDEPRSAAEVRDRGEAVVDGTTSELCEDQTMGFRVPCETRFAPEFAPTSRRPMPADAHPCTLGWEAGPDVDSQECDETDLETSKKALPTACVSKACEIGMTGFEPATSTSRTKLGTQKPLEIQRVSAPKKPKNTPSCKDSVNNSVNSGDLDGAK